MALTSLIMSTVSDLNFLFVLQLLLILSGDVEVNPGPLTQEDKEILSKVDASTFGEDDWNIIVIECNSLAYKWEELSAFLGLRKNVIEGIKKNHPCDVAGCLNDALGQWIKQKYNTRKFGMPSWRKLLEAIALIDNRIFKKLACEHEGTTALSIDQKLSASLPASPRDQTSLSHPHNYKSWRKLLADNYLIDDQRFNTLLASSQNESVCSAFVSETKWDSSPFRPEDCVWKN